MVKERVVIDCVARGREDAEQLLCHVCGSAVVSKLMRAECVSVVRA